MPLTTQLTLGIELTKVFPLRQVVTATGAAMLELARNLRKTGSDLIVEEELAAIFGRGMVNGVLEQRFKDEILKDVSFVPLHPTCQIGLDTGLGPTLHRAMTSRDRYYMSTVIQLSMLAWFHPRGQLASTLADCMAKRSQMELPDTAYAPDLEGITGTLAACSSQTSAFNWGDCVQVVESKLRSKRPRFDWPYRGYVSAITPAMLLAAMDYLYLTQRTPEDRKLWITSQRGLIPMIIWAHLVLSLTVKVQNFPGGDVQFGDQESPQVIIAWEPDHPNTTGASLHLLDRDLKVIFSQTDDDDLQLRGLGVEERHTLRNYGTVVLQRCLNVDSSVDHTDPVFLDIVQLLVAVTVEISLRLFRRYREIRGYDAPIMTAVETDRWAILESAELIFQDIKWNRKAIDHYLSKKAKGKGVLDIQYPRALQTLAEGNGWYESSIPDKIRLFELVNLVLLFAKVSDVKGCAELKLSLHALKTLSGYWGDRVEDQLHWTSADPSILVSPGTLLERAACLLIGESADNDEWPQRRDAFLISDWGWSIFLNTVGDKDPAAVKLECLFIRRGVPTNARTKERKSQIRDGKALFSEGCLPVFDHGESYIPRCALEVARRVEYYTSVRNAFLLSICYEVLDEPTNTSHTVIYGYRMYHEFLWSTSRARACQHRPDNLTKPPRLGVDVTTINVFALEPRPHIPERICVCLVKANRHARWIALSNAARSLDRKIMLRGDDCCEDCAVDAATTLEGRWYVII